MFRAIDHAVTHERIRLAVAKHNRDIETRRQYLFGFRLVGFGQAKSQVIVGGPVRIQYAAHVFRVVHKLNFRKPDRQRLAVVRWDPLERNVRGSVGANRQPFVFAIRFPNHGAHVIRHLGHERLAFVHEILRLGDSAFAHDVGPVFEIGNHCGLATVHSETQGLATLARVRAKVADASGIVRGHVIDCV